MPTSVYMYVLWRLYTIMYPGRILKSCSCQYFMVVLEVKLLLRKAYAYWHRSGSISVKKSCPMSNLSAELLVWKFVSRGFPQRCTPLLLQCITPGVLWRSSVVSSVEIKLAQRSEQTEVFSVILPFFAGLLFLLLIGLLFAHSAPNLNLI